MNLQKLIDTIDDQTPATQVRIITRTFQSYLDAQPVIDQARIQHDFALFTDAEMLEHRENERAFDDIMEQAFARSQRAARDD